MNGYDYLRGNVPMDMTTIKLLDMRHATVGLFEVHETIGNAMAL
jgi:hypothetical protein